MSATMPKRRATPATVRSLALEPFTTVEPPGGRTGVDGGAGGWSGSLSTPGTVRLVRPGDARRRWPTRADVCRRQGLVGCQDTPWSSADVATGQMTQARAWGAV